MRTLLLNRTTMLALLAIVSIILYLFDYFVLGSARDIASSFLGNLAFLPIYVMFVTLMIEQILRERERLTVMRKLNMVIGVFFSEVGNHLLKELSACVLSSDEMKRRLLVTGSWKDEDYIAALSYLKAADIRIDGPPDRLTSLKGFLVARRSFLVSLLENQNLLEHEEFTDLLWSVFHLVEELEARPGFDDMPRADADHINGDIKRAYGHLSREWILYMRHLKTEYPYLFSLAVRLNPMLDRVDARLY